MDRQATMPLLRGIRMSISTTSGSDSAALATASAPSHASPTTSMSSSSLRTISRPRRNSAWSSTISTRIGSAYRRRPRLPRSALTVPPALYQTTATGGSRPRYLLVAGSQQPPPPLPKLTRRAPAPGPAVNRLWRSRSRHASAGERYVHSTPLRGAPRLRAGRDAPTGSALHEADDTVVVAEPPVHDAGMPATGVAEHADVVADEFHLEQRLVQRHGAGRVGLLPHDERAIPLHLDGHNRIRCLDAGPGA